MGVMDHLSPSQKMSWFIFFLFLLFPSSKYASESMHCHELLLLTWFRSCVLIMNLQIAESMSDQALN